jgi:D-glycero-beta-D-manno-heptose 1-phosphate adenylyltransferase
MFIDFLKHRYNITLTMKDNLTAKYVPTFPDPKDVKFLNIMGNDPCPEDRIIRNREKLKWVIGVLKKEGKKIVYTSGVYDLIHDGHMKYLAKAKALGDVLVVGVDDNELTRQRKPDEKNRPIDDLEVRLTTLVHNRSVNILVVRTAHEKLEQLVMDVLPDIAVFSLSTKDNDNFEGYIRSLLKDYCGEIIFFEPQSSNSTTAKIRLVAGNGAHELALHLKKDLDGKVDSVKLEESLQSYFSQKGGTP